MNTTKTPEQFRELLEKGFDITVVTEMVNTFAGESGKITIKPPFEWDHRIESVYIPKKGPCKGKLRLGIYWQGDLTDGNESADAEEVVRRGRYVIPAVHYFECGRTHEKHSDIIIDRDELNNVAATLSDWLSPEAFAERAKQEEQYRFYAKVKTVTDNLYKEFIKDRWDRDERWYNGYAAVNKCAELHCEELMQKNDEELTAILRKVFLANRKYDINIPKDKNGKKYNLDIE